MVSVVVTMAPEVFSRKCAIFSALCDSWQLVLLKTIVGFVKSHTVEKTLDVIQMSHADVFFLGV